ncbi:DUF3109 domain-containing protein [Haloferula helveola]|uniref:DUF3109 domain-containing protein n=1 Tax=Haloferula helveola TaxID=490095 RepID=A0ABM7RCH4_9BACT|nr:DUF3109 domain-containing protein [Haloferula helveola]
MKPNAHTAFADLELELGRQVREAALDHEAFSMPLKVCELASCRATCCHDGVFLDREQASVIGGIVESGQLTRYGFHRSYWSEQAGGRVKTSTVEASAAELADGFPAHFPRTRCVFLDAEHRCVLQRLAMDSGMHPWWWKPVSCWMHPLLFRRLADGRPLLGLASADDDPSARPGYPGFGSCTPCGMPNEGGEPAWKVLRGELELLGRIGGRDLVRELGGGDH